MHNQDENQLQAGHRASQINKQTKKQHAEKLLIKIYFVYNMLHKWLLPVHTASLTTQTTGSCSVLNRVW